jgi:hypothetical protein
LTAERDRHRPKDSGTTSESVTQQSESLAEPSKGAVIVSPQRLPAVSPGVLSGVGAEDLSGASLEDEPEEILREIAKGLTNWAKDNRERLRLDPNLTVAARDFQSVHRIAASGELLSEMVVHFVQTPKSSEDLGGLNYRAGVTMIANIEGYIRYLIQKPLHENRKRGLDEWVKEFDDANDGGWPSGKRDPNRIKAAFSARAMARKRWR